jgi:hypothetical protein
MFIVQGVENTQLQKYKRQTGNTHPIFSVPGVGKPGAASIRKKHLHTRRHHRKNPENYSTFRISEG